jgi:hypothetical protein
MRLRRIPYAAVCYGPFYLPMPFVTAYDDVAVCCCMLQDGVTRSRARPSTRSLPDWALAPDAAVFLNIPMDAETPR